MSVLSNHVLEEIREKAQGGQAPPAEAPPAWLRPAPVGDGGSAKPSHADEETTG